MTSPLRSSSLVIAAIALLFVFWSCAPAWAPPPDDHATSEPPSTDTMAPEDDPPPDAGPDFPVGAIGDDPPLTAAPPPPPPPPDTVAVDHPVTTVTAIAGPSFPTTADPPVPDPSIEPPTPVPSNPAIRLARVRLDYPGVMWVGEKEMVTAQIAPEHLRDLLGSEARPGLATGEWQVAVTRRVRAELSGPGFEVEPVSDAEQLIAEDTPVEWRWHVTPLRGGETETLTLRIVRIVTTEAGGESRATLPSREFKVEVKVNRVRMISASVLGFMQTNWTSVWTLLLVPAAAAVWAWWRRKKATAAGPPTP